MLEKAMSVKQKIKDQGVLVKAVVIVLLILILLIPMSMIQGLMHERQYRSNNVVREISQQWSGEQALVGPILSINYKQHYGSNGKFYTKYMHLMPEELNVKTNLIPEVRYRGIFKAVIYSSHSEITGKFDLDEFKKHLTKDQMIEIESLVISMGINDKRGIKEKIIFNANGVGFPMQTISKSKIFNSGVETHIDTPPVNNVIDFTVSLDLNGSEGFSVLPIGKDTNVDIASTWNTPSFFGSFLPDARDVSADGFSAKWRVLEMNHSLPHVWNDSYQLPQSINSFELSHSVGKSSAISGFGVRLMIPASAYQQSIRSAKYALLFIALTFLCFFVAEVLNKNRVHPMQYMLIGLSLVMFYSLLISLSEHINFNLAYSISAVAVTFLISGYSKAILLSKKLSKIIFALLTGLYVYLYILLQLESYALILGSVGLFISLAVVMYLTRNINWYTETSSN